MDPVGTNNMTLEDNRTAKEIFMYYGGSHFFMDREGDYERYKSFYVSQEQERDWYSELQANLLAKLDADPADTDSFSDFCRTVIQNKDADALRLIVLKSKAIHDHIDSFTKLLMAEQFLRVIDGFGMKTTNSDVLQAYDTAIEFLNEVLKQPITVAPRYRDNGYLQDVIRAQKIIERAEKALKKWTRK
ncbi:MAG TPA: hypothetical protein DER40_16215 [Geobacter sp.]|nr:MAG: hypothetical protein A2X85_11755 [Geobacteraceae bacterium GWF2_54_21]HCE68987.1 hypothetical protein [Geobacter sp.]